MRATCCNALCRETELYKFLPSNLCVPLLSGFSRDDDDWVLSNFSLWNPHYCAQYTGYVSDWSNAAQAQPGQPAAGETPTMYNDTAQQASQSYIQINGKNWIVFD